VSETRSSAETAIEQIISACLELGWDIAIPESDEDVPVVGFIIGTSEYVDHVTECVNFPTERIA